MHPFVPALFALGIAAPFTAPAQDVPVAPAVEDAARNVLDGPIRDEERVLVSGALPGPGLWRVRNGDRTLWVLGTLSPLPKKMEWVSRDVEVVLAQAQEVIWAPGVRVGADIGIFQGLLLAPKALRARRNPDGALLREMVPPAMYARWEVLKQRYIGRDRGIEKWRPMFAAMELYDEAMDDVGLAKGGIVGPVVTRAVKHHGIPQTSPTVTITIADPKKALDEFRQASLDDQDCFGKTIDRLETDLDTMRERANAWAVGDIESLRALPYSDHSAACMKAAMQAGAMRKRSTGDTEIQMREAWIKAAETALDKNAVTFSMLPMRELLDPDGYLAQLQAMGYEVEAP